MSEEIFTSEPVTSIRKTATDSTGDSKKEEAKSAEKYVFTSSTTIEVPKHHTNSVAPNNQTQTKDGIIFSSNFASCIGVVAKLKNGGFALYHATNPLSQQQGFKDFVRDIQGKVQEFFVFQKTGSSDLDKKVETSADRNAKKAVFLALELSTALRVPAKLIKVKNYDAIICDAQHNQVILTRKLHTTTSESSIPTSISITGMEDAKDIDKEISSAIQDDDELMNTAYTLDKEMADTVWANKKSHALSQTLTAVTLVSTLALEHAKTLNKQDRISLLKKISLATNDGIAIENFFKAELGNDFNKTDIVNLYVFFANKLDIDSVRKTLISRGQLRRDDLYNLVLRYAKSTEISEKIALSMITSKKIQGLSYIKTRTLCHIFPGFKTKFLQTSYGIKWVKNLTLDRVLYTADILGEEFILLLLQNNRFLTDIPQINKEHWLDQYENIGVIVAKYYLLRKEISNQCWSILIVKYPSVATIALQDPSWNLIDKLPKEKLITVAVAENGRNALAIFKRFHGIKEYEQSPVVKKDKKQDEKSSSLFSGFMGLTMFSSTDKNVGKFTTGEWLKIFIAAGAAVKDMIPSTAFNQFNESVLISLLANNPHASLPVLEIFCGHGTKSMLATRKAIEMLTPDEKVVGLQLVANNTAIAEKFGSDFWMEHCQTSPNSLLIDAVLRITTEDETPLIKEDNREILLALLQEESTNEVSDQKREQSAPTPPSSTAIPSEPSSHGSSASSSSTSLF